MVFSPLHDDWTVEAVTGPVPDAVAGRRVPATVPGQVHTDLLAAGLITDPFDGDAESAQQWIGDTSWRFSTTFTWHDDGSVRHDLVAEGLDTVAVVELNGRVVARTENQHRSYRVDVREALVEGRNALTVTFAAPVAEAEARVELHGALPHVNHHPFNMLRKQASSFGWDWGVDVAGAGIWRPIGLDSWSGVRIASVRPLVRVDEAPQSTGATGTLDARVALEWDGVTTGEHRVAVEVTSPEGDRVAEASVDVAVGTAEAALELVVPDARLWWPLGHGDQPLYGVRVTAAPVDDGAGGGAPDATTASWTSRVGFRTVRVDTTPDADGTPFVVLVNERVVQVRGANWIPDHAFVTEIDRDRYRRRVADATEANMNLLRVWGGGIYESDDFYDACDEAGVLVWQDFLFACAAYAEEDWLAVEVEAEAREAITRLSPHPSLVIWNGNNENIWGFVDWGWKTELQGRTWGDGYYRELLPRLVAELDGTRAYSPGSPFSFGDPLASSDEVHPNDHRHGTMHIWDVWNRRDYTAYREYPARFVSEFGFQGPPAWSTLVGSVHDEPLDPYGHQMLVHQKAEEGNLKLERGMQGHLPAPATIEDWHWATQLNQAAAIRFGVEHFRSLAPLNTGTIVWQLNDDWPVTSWAAVDFDEHRKPLWFALRDCYAPRLATIQPRGDSLAVVLLNDVDDAWAGDVVLRRTTFAGDVLDEVVVPGAVGSRGSVELTVPSPLVDALDPAAELLVAVLPDFGSGRAVWDAAEVVDQRLDPDPVATEVVRDGDAWLVTVTARSYARDVTLLVDVLDPRATVDRGLVTLLAGESATFRVAGRDGAASLDPDALVGRTVLRHANGLLLAVAP
ncbi:glycosyl hydrolase 2 galactose-binding domain-containing protein [uncultured Frigoribacterium sp.]|uniref:glycoside hydrolase family 2 protein n=1 Tax=uncultured Frigoribacterium sp. TaxID=335377 RepID=UPI0028D0FF10|nr:glycoside hydrolase family 2 protein [uncultured Frigoribacterium sp.]